MSFLKKCLLAKKDTTSVGRLGEDIACRYLENSGYRIVTRNYRRRYGEIDIIAKEDGWIVFVEVKTRRGFGFAGPLEAVDRFKQRQISKLALDFLARNNLLDSPARFDVVAIVLGEDNSAQVRLIKNGFELQGV